MGCCITRHRNGGSPRRSRRRSRDRSSQSKSSHVEDVKAAEPKGDKKYFVHIPPNSPVKLYLFIPFHVY